MLKILVPFNIVISTKNLFLKTGGIYVHEKGRGQFMENRIYSNGKLVKNFLKINF